MRMGKSPRIRSTSYVTSSRNAHASDQGYQEHKADGEACRDRDHQHEGFHQRAEAVQHVDELEIEPDADEEASDRDHTGNRRHHQESGEFGQLEAHHDHLQEDHEDERFLECPGPAEPPAHGGERPSVGDDEKIDHGGEKQRLDLKGLERAVVADRHFGWPEDRALNEHEHRDGDRDQAGQRPERSARHAEGEHRVGPFPWRGETLPAEPQHLFGLKGHVVVLCHSASASPTPQNTTNAPRARMPTSDKDAPGPTKPATSPWNSQSGLAASSAQKSARRARNHVPRPPRMRATTWVSAARPKCASRANLGHCATKISAQAAIRTAIARSSRAPAPKRRRNTSRGRTYVRAISLTTLNLCGVSTASRRGASECRRRSPRPRSLRSPRRGRRAPEGPGPATSADPGSGDRKAPSRRSPPRSSRGSRPRRRRRSRVRAWRETARPRREGAPG